jgi:hypothetical protein
MSSPAAAEPGDDIPSGASRGPKKEDKTTGAGGYHYFHERANKGTAPKAEPKRLTAEEAAALAKRLEGSGGSGLSSWNTAGTWEEREHTRWAERRVAELLVGATFPAGPNASATLTKIRSFKGDATVVMVRGQPRHGFDFDVTVQWECVFGEGEECVKVKGAAHVPEASRQTVDDDEVEYSVAVDDRKPEKRDAEEKAREALQTCLREFFRATFKTIDEELRRRAES